MGPSDIIQRTGMALLNVIDGMTGGGGGARYPAVVVPDAAGILGNSTSAFRVEQTFGIHFDELAVDASDDVTTTITTSLNESGGVVNELPQFHQPVYKAIGFAFVGTIFAVGLIGNLMVVLVVWRTRSMRTPTNCYLVSLAVADILLLVSAPLPTLIEFFLIVDQSVFGAVGCAAMVFAQYLGINVSSLSITAFTIERYIAICHAMKAQTMCTVRRAKRISLAVWIFGIAYCSPWLAMVTSKPLQYADGTRIERCNYRLERNHYQAYYMADLTIFYVIPLLLTCILYALIARILFTSARPTSSSSYASSTTRQSAAAAANRGSRHHQQQQQRGNQKVDAERKKNDLVPRRCTTRVKGSKSSASSRIQVTKMLAVVVCVFAVLWLPYRAYVVYNSFATNRYENRWLMLFCRLMVYANSAINPILYSAMSAKFNRAFRRLLLCGRAGPMLPGTTGTNTCGGDTMGGFSAARGSSTALRHHHGGTALGRRRPDGRLLTTALAGASAGTPTGCITDGMSVANSGASSDNGLNEQWT